MKKNKLFFIIMAIYSLMLVGKVSAQDAPKGSQAELEEVAAKLIDPLSDLWFIMMNNFTTNVTNTQTGDRHTMNQFMLQPVFPVVLKKDKFILGNRASIFATTVPNFSDGSSQTHVTNFQWSSVFGVKTENNILYGIGPALALPAYNALSSRNFKIGATALLFYTPSENFITGFNYTHLVDLETRDQVVNTNSGILQYLITYRITPLISIASASQLEMVYTNTGMKYNLPLGLSIGKTFFLGPIPASVSLGYQYVVKNNELLTSQNLRQDHRISIALFTVMPNLFHLDKFTK